jgi:sulfur carrier protein ThiS
MNHVLTLVVSPGVGKRYVEVAPGTTIADLIHSMQLHQRSMIANGEEVPAEAFGTTVLDDIQELWAVGATKGA